MASGATTLQETAAEWSEYLIDGSDRSVTARQDGTVPPAQAVDLPFRALMGDPFTPEAEMRCRTCRYEEHLGVEREPLE